MYSKILLAAGLAMQATAATIRVNVGKDSQLTFAPSSFNASVGDIVEFHFYARNHSVAQGDFDNACNPVPSAGFFSGFFPTNGTVQNANVFSVTINNTQPIAFYCTQNNNAHCKNGMVGVINPTTASSLANYQAKAKDAQIAVSPPTVFGGAVAPAPAEPSTTTSAGGSTTSPSSTATTTTKPNAAGSIKVSIAGLAAAAAFALCLA